MTTENLLRISATQYVAADLPVGIVHIGLGAFVRAHIAVYLEKLLNTSEGAYGICAANIRSNAQIVDVLNDQQQQYTVAEHAADSAITLRQISCVREVLYAGAGHVSRLLERLKDPAIKIVSLTVTEKGYFFDASQQRLKVESAEIKHDISKPKAPKTAMGILVAGLRYCYENNQAPFTVMSCDNMPHNGQSTRNAVLQLAAHQDQSLADWIAATVAFPSTMVDRIVPATTEETVSTVNALLGQAKASWCVPRDNAPIACESFSQWVIEDVFTKDRPDFSKVGAAFVKDVAPWEEMKLRMLNGSHSLIAYLGCLAGYKTVATCMADEALVKLIKTYMLEEAAPTLNMPGGVDLEAYAQALLQRFSNASLQHQTRQIAMDGSQKIPQRWLQGACINLQAGNFPKITALGLAAWIVYLQNSQVSPGYSIDDPLASELIPLALAANSREGVEAFVQHSALAKFELAAFPELIESMVDSIKLLKEDVQAIFHH
jgi:fructuronate reductase